MECLDATQKRLSRTIEGGVERERVPIRQNEPYSKEESNCEVNELQISFNKT
jgi:hypothetical protein